jgi:hypothetical protein
MERLPHQLDDWLRLQLATGGELATAAIEQVEATILEPVIEMNRRGLFQFDPHLGNLLTDGTRVLVADFGLATALDFDLDEQERDFLARHQLHDPAYTITKFVNRLVTDLVGLENPAARNAYIADHATTHHQGGSPQPPTPYSDAMPRSHRSSTPTTGGCSPKHETCHSRQSRYNALQRPRPYQGSRRSGHSRPGRPPSRCSPATPRRRRIIGQTAASR